MILSKYLFGFIQGCRIPTLSAVILPVCMASAWAYYKETDFDSTFFVLTLSSGLFLQMAVNFFNDALDFEWGTDGSKRLGPSRLSQTGRLPARHVLGFGILCAGLSVLTGIPLIVRGGWFVALFGGVSLLCAYFYTGRKMSLVQMGLSEIFVVLFFGFGAVGMTYYLQTLSWDLDLFYLSFQCGLWSLSILLVNYLRDEEEDRASGRKHFVTLYGRITTLFILSLIQIIIYLFCFYWLNLSIDGGAFSFFLIVPSSVLIYFIGTTPPSRKYNLFLFCMSSLYILFGAAWIFGIPFK